MKRLITLFLILMSFGLFAQIDVTIGTGTVQNTTTSYPAPYGNFYWGARHQFIIPAAEIIAAGGYAGNILSLAFDVATVQGTPLQNFEIRMGTTTATFLGSWEAGPFSMHYISPLYTEVLGWNTHTFSTPFYWDGTSSLIIESCFNNSSWVYNAIVNQTTTTYNSSRWYNSDAAGICAMVGTATAMQRPNMKLSFAPNSPLDAGISAINSPVPPVAPGLHAVTATLNNYGTDTLTICTVNWSVNGVLQAPYAWTGSLPSTQATAPLALGSFNFPGGNNTIKVWSSAPNNGTDGFNGNDTATNTMFFSAPFMGTYTIGGPAANFQSLSAAYSAMALAGMGGAVTFSFDPAFGPYTGGVEMGTVPGSSSTNTLTLEGNGAIIEAGSPTFILAINGLSWATINNFKLINPVPANNKFGIMVRGGVQHINITNNLIDVGTTSTSSLTAGIAVSNSITSATTAGNNGQYINISNNEIVGGYYSITLMGAFSYLNCYGNSVINNIVRDFYLYGIYLSNCDTAMVKGNTMTRASRSTLSTFYGIYASTSRNIKYIDNQIHSSGVGSYSAYPFYITASVNTLGYESEFINNTVFNITTTGTIYGFYMLGTRDYLNFYHNTVSLNYGTGTQRAMFFSGAPNNHKLFNNIFSIEGSGTGTKYCIYTSATSTSFTANYNNYYMGATAGTNHVGYWGTNQTTLSAWQLATSQDGNAVNINPVFASPASGDITPLSGTMDNLGTPIGVLTDVLGNPRSTTTPDLGAIEFTGVSADMAMIAGELVNGACLSANDSVYVTIANVIGSTINFSTATTTVTWSVTGPVNSTGNIIINSGSLATSAAMTVGGAGVNMSVPGTYTLSAYISANSVNLYGGNDTLNQMASLTIYSPLAVVPKHVVITNTVDTVEITAQSTFFPPGAFFFSEICHYKFSTGAPISGWPTYLLADDYIEITGVPNSDLAGHTLEQWNTATMVSTHTFAPGTLLGPNGTAVIAVGQMGSSAAVPASYYYHGNGSFTSSFGSSEAIGRILKDGNGSIVDAHGYNGYNFPAAANVPASEWSSPLSGGGSTSGQRLIGPDNNTGTNWVVSSAIYPQDPNAVNAGVTVPSPSSLTGFSWSLNSVVTSTNVVDTVVGPWSTSGLYQYVASYVTPCGTYTDTVSIHVALITILAGDTTICQGDTAMISVALPGTGPWTVVGTDGIGVDTMTVTTLPWISYVNPHVTTTFTLLSYADASNVFLNVNIPIVITVIPGPSVTLPSYSSVCVGDSAFMLTGGLPSGGTYGGPGVTAGLFDPMAAGAGAHFVTYSYTDLTTGCSSTAAEQIFVDGGVAGTLTADHDICAGQSTTLVFTTPSAATPTVIFSEYIEGTSNNKALEIFNATTDTVDLADYRIGQSVNGGGWAYWHYFPAGAKLAPHNTWVIVANQVSASIYDTANADEVLAFPSVVHYNGDDARSVEVTTDGGLTWTIIDIIGDPDNDPGTGWPVAGINNATADKTLIRKPEIFAGNTDWLDVAGTDSLSSEYTVYPVNYFANLGSHSFIAPPTVTLTYVWSTSATTPTITVSPTVTTTYTVTVSSTGSTCDNIQSVVVTVNPAPAINLGADFDVCDDGTAILDAGSGFATYLWSTGATTHAITVDGATIGLGNTLTYSLTVTNSFGCEATSSVNVTAIDCTGLDEPDAKSALTFWPNPTDGNFFVKIKGISGDATLRISSITGQTISTENLTLDGEWLKEFNLGNLAPGIYFVRLSTKSNVVTKQIIIK